MATLKEKYEAEIASLEAEVATLKAELEQLAPWFDTEVSDVKTYFEGLVAKVSKYL